MIENLFSVLLYLGTQLEELELARQYNIRFAQPLNRVEGVQYLKAILEIEGWPPGDDVCQMARTIDTVDKLYRLLRNFTEMIDELINLLFDRIHEGLHFDALNVAVKHRRAAHPVEGSDLGRSVDTCPMQPFEDDPSRAVGKFRKLLQACNDADRWELLWLVALVALKLSFAHEDEEYLAVLFPCPLHRTVGFALWYLERNGHMGHDHHLTENHQG